MDSQYQKLHYVMNTRDHAYGDNVHLVSDPFCISLLANLCNEKCEQPLFNHHIRFLYHNLGLIAANQFFPRSHVKVPTRMAKLHPEAVFEGEVLNPNQKIILVAMARAGTIPSNSLMEMYTNIVDPMNVRVDHIYINRTVDKDEKVTGAHLSGSKIGGDISDAIMIIPDPMGATGGSINQVLDYYKQHVTGKPKAWISLQLMLTPEFIRNVTAKHPDVTIMSYRLDRGFSTPEALKNIPGKLWNEEKGLNAKSYIVPGGGGFGELMSHAWV
jgi:uracil phosphoribosyltransferase